MPVANLAPQMADYDLLSRKIDWRPYIMFFHQANFSSPTVTTDCFGFRPALDENGRAVALEGAQDRTVNLLLGNSVAFGVGATSDAASLASRLSAHSGECWLNFCGRSFGVLQELLLYECYRHKLGQVGRVLLCSGLNDLYLSYAPKMFDETFGVFILSEAFYRGMNESQIVLSRKRELLASLLRPIYGNSINYATFGLRDVPGLLRRKPSAIPPEIDFDALIASRRRERDRVVEQIGRTLLIWSALGRAFGFEVSYAVQPMLPWTGKRWSAEEQELIAEQDRTGGRWQRILETVLDDEHHQWFAAGVRRACEQAGVSFLDPNAALRQDDRWLFVDRVHMNDDGQDLLAQAIVRELTPAREVAYS